MKRIVLSIVVPVYNEAANIEPFYDLLEPYVRAETRKYEIIYIDDGSSDDTADCVGRLRRSNDRVKLISLSRNFGKEIAMAAGLAAATGEAAIVIDGDGQHPPDRITDFVRAWQNGAQVVIGVRTENHNEGWIKRYGSRLFYMLFNRLSGVTMVPGSSDFRLLDREVVAQFKRLHEPDTITRGLIDWLGYKRTYIHYAAKPRLYGTASYKLSLLVKLAAHSFISLSRVPLYAFGYLGIVITVVSFLLGFSILVEQLMLGDPLGWNFTGTAMLSILVLFLIGVVLVSQGVLALYISFVHTQSKGRPLYVINQRTSQGVDSQEIMAGR